MDCKFTVTEIARLCSFAKLCMHIEQIGHYGNFVMTRKTREFKCKRNKSLHVMKKLLFFHLKINCIFLLSFSPIFKWIANANFAITQFLKNSIQFIIIDNSL